MNITQVVLIPVVQDALELQRKARDGKSFETRAKAKFRLASTLQVMSEKALRQYSQYCLPLRGDGV